MYFSRPPYILFREYPDFGYLTDNRNFGYDTVSKSCLKTGDRILSKTGSVFYSILTEKAQTVHEIAGQLLPLFHGVSLSELEHDAKDFFLELSGDGFVRYGKDVDSSSSANYFSYTNTSPYELTTIDDGFEDTVLSVNWGSDYHLSRIHVDVSGLCNEHCVHCYIPDKFRNRTMPKELFQVILDQSKASRVLNMTISGGEPMLNPSLLDFIQECRDNNFSINLLSNLTLLTDEMVHEFEKTPLLSIQTSLYSMSEEIHDSITQSRGSFIKTKRAIEMLHQYNIPMQINCPIMKQNKDTYQDVLDWAKSMNIESSSDYMLFGRFDGSCKNLQCRLGLSDIESIIYKERISDKVNTEKHAPGASICPVLTNSICISHTGDIYPCEGWQSYVLGNIRTSSLSKIWDESPDVQKLRALTYDDFPKCRSCDKKDYCSICLIRNVNESKRLDYKDVNPYFCEVARIKKRMAKNCGR